MPPALAAFLRGIERRGFVFARAQCGSEAIALTTLAQTVRGFLAEAANLPLALWPSRFWSGLLGQPALLQADAAGSPLASLTPGPRAALLLRLVAGLDLAHAAQVLGVSEAAYRYALQRALREAAAAGLDAGELQALHDRLLLEVKQLNAAQQQALQALHEQPIEVPPDAPTRTRATAPSPSRQWPWVGLAVLGLAFAATFVWSPSPHLQPGQSQALAPELISGAVVLDDAAVVTHPDYALLAYPQDQALAGDLGFLSWLAAGSPGYVAPADAPAALPETATPESADGDGEVTPP